MDTCGNSDCHVILRGGKVPNYDAKSVEAACAELRAAKLPERIMIDLSHGNSAKDYHEQLKVGAGVSAQIAGGEMRIMGVIAESNLVEGRQAVSGKKRLVYGQSITDPCLGWDDSVMLLGQFADAVRSRRKTRK